MGHLPTRIDRGHAVSRASAIYEPRPAEAKWKTWALTAAVVVFSVVGNVTLSHGMRQVGSDVVSWNPLPYLYSFANPWVVGGVLILALWMISELALLSRADLSFVLPVTSTAYVLIAIAGHFVLNEPVSWTRWAGIIVITLGVILVAETPPRTTPEPPPEGHHH